jgi:hypothetical protein
MAWFSAARARERCASDSQVACQCSLTIRPFTQSLYRKMGESYTREAIPGQTGPRNQTSYVMAIHLHREDGGEALYFRDPDRHLLEVVMPGVWSIY